MFRGRVERRAGAISVQAWEAHGLPGQLTPGLPCAQLVYKARRKMGYPAPATRLPSALGYPAATLRAQLVYPAYRTELRLQLWVQGKLDVCAAEHFVGKGFPTTNICAQPIVSTRVGGYMKRAWSRVRDMMGLS